jgi:hypothetical protein
MNLQVRLRTPLRAFKNQPPSGGGGNDESSEFDPRCQSDHDLLDQRRSFVVVDDRWVERLIVLKRHEG